jgi:hypothetical protein
MRRAGRLVAFICVLMLGAGGVAACETFAGPADTSPLHTRKPLDGEDVRLTTGFGLRRHPILMVAKMHTGVDWSAPIGTSTIAAAGGRLSFSARKGNTATSSSSTMAAAGRRPMRIFQASRWQRGIASRP